MCWKQFYGIVGEKKKGKETLLDFIQASHWGLIENVKV